MTVKDGIQKIKAMFDAMPPVAPVAPVAAAATDYTLADGTTVVSIDKLEVGGIVMIGDAIAPDAVHTLADGTTITTVSGLITEIKMASVEPTETLSAEMASMKAGFTKQTKEQASTIEALRVDLAAQKEIVKEMFAMVEIMGAQDAGAPTEKTIGKEWEQMSSLEKRRASK